MSEKKWNRLKGRQGEALAETFLEQKGYRILERNFQSPFGEIDLVASHQKTLVFVEVKARRDHSFGFPEESVNRRKKMKLAKLASWYLLRFPRFPQVRFDVLAIQKEGPDAGIRLIQNAFEV